MSARAEGARTLEVRAPAFVDRLLAAVPLLTMFIWLCLVYAFEAWGHRTPWNFTDELEWTQIARSIATTGHAARRGVPTPFKSVYSYLTAPAWKLHDAHSSYDAVKYGSVFVMTSVLFPTYALARMVCGRRASIFAAATAAAIPALVYSSFIVTEPLAYPYAALCLFLIAKALVTRRLRWIVGAAVAVLVAPYVRSELGILIAVYLLAALALVATSDAARRRYARWSRWDWVGAVTLLVGIVVYLSAYIGHHSYSWLIATGYYKGRMLDYGLYAAGALAIGLGVFPVVAGLAFLFPTRGERRSVELRVLRSVLGASIVAFGLYTAVKASYLSTVFEGRVEERNLIYIAPLLLVGTAVWLERRHVSLVGLGCAAAFVLALILVTPYKMDNQIYADAPGLAILAQGNRFFKWTPQAAQTLLVVMLAITVAILLAPRFVRARPGIWNVVAACTAAAVFLWTLTAEVAAAEGSNNSADFYLNTMHRPVDWLDRATPGSRVLYLGEHVTDPNGVHLLEFWNRHLTDVWSLDGTAPGPGPTLSPDLADIAGDLVPDPHIPYVVADTGVAVAGKLVEKHARLSGGGRQYWRLYKVQPPFRLRANVSGRDPDGWITASRPNEEAIGAYNNYWTPGGRPGRALVTVSRRESGVDAPAHVTIYVGTLIVDNTHQPQMGHVTAVRKLTINEHQQQTFLIGTPSVHFRVEVHVSPTFQPCMRDPVTSGDCRYLGVVARFGVVPPGESVRKADRM